MKISFKNAGLQDVKELIEAQNKSFYADFIKYGECPAYGESYEGRSNTGIGL